MNPEGTTGDVVVDAKLERRSRVEFTQLTGRIRPLRTRALAIMPEAGSPLSRLDARTRTAPFSNAVRFQLQAAANHLDLLVNAVERDGTIQYGAYTLIRGAIEAGVTARWFMLPGTDSKRVLRSLQIAWWDQDDASDLATAAGLSHAEDLARIRTNLDEDRRGMKALQQRSLDKPRVHRTTMIREVDEKASPRLSPSVEASWRLCSGLAHGNQATSNMMMQMRRVDPANPDMYRAASSWAIVTPLTRTTCALVDSAIEQFQSLGRARPSTLSPTFDERGGPFSAAFG